MKKEEGVTLKKDVYLEARRILALIEDSTVCPDPGEGGCIPGYGWLYQRSSPKRSPHAGQG